MKTAESRGIKIDLQIRRRRENIDSPSNNKAKVQMPTTKSTNHSKKLNVTIHNKHEQKKNQPAIPQVEIKKIIISEFKVNDSESNSLILPKSLNISNARPYEVQSSRDNVCTLVSQQPSSIQWQQMQIKQKKQKSEIIPQILKKEAQIQFYEHLLEEKTSQSKHQIQIRQREYEEYIESLISRFQAEVQKCKQLSKQIQDKQFQKKRQTINLEGKMGLNFSPKQLSTFSGMSAGSILLDSVQKYNPSEVLKKRRSELYSFGSSNKLDKSSSMSKQFGTASFLNPGRTLVQKGKRITFE